MYYAPQAIHARLTYWYQGLDLVISSILPSEGPVAGATLVTVSGFGFSNLGRPRCRFGMHDTEAAALPSASSDDVLAEGASLNFIVCSSPPYVLDTGMASERVTFEISLNGAAGDYSASGLLFEYQQRCADLPRSATTCGNEPFDDPHDQPSEAEAVISCCSVDTCARNEISLHERGVCTAG